MGQQGFFPLPTINSSHSNGKAPSLVARCDLCKLDKQCKSPKMPYSGRGSKKILICGEAAGENEDYENKQFVGKTGDLLRDALREFNVNMREDCWLTNSIICRPKNNRTPTDQEVQWCRPNVLHTIRELNPRVILLLGAAAVKSVIGWLWKEDTGGVGRWIGWKIPAQKINSWICPAWHPSFISRVEKESNGSVAKLLWTQHLKEACSINYRPPKEQDLKSSIQCILDPLQAAKKIKAFRELKDPVGWDIETDRIKPDYKDSEIISCSISSGLDTISFPWIGEAIQETLLLLQDPQVKKYGWNIGFETRWILAKHNVRIKGWDHDGMITSHILDNRSGTKSLKVQSFIHFGMEDYDSQIKPYMSSVDGTSNGKNRIRDYIREHGWQNLLIYGGLDALLEFKIGSRQKEELERLSNDTV